MYDLMISETSSFVSIYFHELRHYTNEEERFKFEDRYFLSFFTDDEFPGQTTVKIDVDVMFQVVTINECAPATKFVIRH